MIILDAFIGLVIGGIINVLADVLPYRHKKVSAPTCPACGQPRSKTQFLAMVAFLIGKGKCSSCGRPMPIRNLVVEISMAAAVVLLSSHYHANLATLFTAVVDFFNELARVADYVRLETPVLQLFSHYFDLIGSMIRQVLPIFFTAVLLLVTVTDLEHRLIPNRAIIPAIVIAALVSPLWFGPGWYLALVGGAIGYGFFWLAVQLGDRFLGRGAMGWGDVKLAAFVGLITGFPGIITALVVTIIAGGVISLILLVTRIVNLRSGIPYGPFICLGGFITMLYGQQIMARFFFGT